ncbi:MAG TPA: hypothetical protein VIM99_14420 [Blastocatellia bacterium]
MPHQPYVCDAKAVVRAWVWTVGALRPRLLNDLDVRVGIADTPLVWVGADRLAVLAWERGANRRGSRAVPHARAATTRAKRERRNSCATS